MLRLHCRLCLNVGQAWQAPTRGIASSSSAQSNLSHIATSISSATNRKPKTKSVPQPRGPIDSPTSFLSAISVAPRRDLASNSAITGALGEKWDQMFKLNSSDLKQKGVPVKDRRYILWALEKFRQGEEPKDFAYQPKPKKQVRGWGPRVQKGIRVSGRLRPGEKMPKRNRS